MKHILGVDIAQDQFDCCLLSAGARQTHQFPNTPRGCKALARWLAQAGVPHAELLACLEATGIYGEALLVWLHEQGVAAAKVNPAQIKHYARSLLARNKTDRLDAFIIAQFAEERSAKGTLRLWRPPTAELAHWRALTRLLAARKEQLARERRRAATVPAGVRAHTRAMIRSFEAQIQKLQTEIEAVIAASPEFTRKCDLLRTIPCVGPVTAQTVIAELPADLTSGRAAAAYAGLTPERDDSGQKSGPGRLSKTGNAHLRQAMYMPAVSGRKSNVRLKACAARLQGRGKTTKQGIAACMHLLLRLCCGVMASGQPFDPAWKGRAAAAARPE